VQRNKSFLVVFSALVFAAGVQAQDLRPAGPGLPLEKGAGLEKMVSPTKNRGSRIPGIPDGREGSLGLRRMTLPLTGTAIEKPVTGLAGPFSATPDQAFPRTFTQPVANDYYIRHFGFFCQKELIIEKTTRIPLRFRLGSLDYVNHLEGKR
jgi:hypothetical protein